MVRMAACPSVAKMEEEASGELGCYRRKSTEEQKDSLGSTARHGKYSDNLEETDGGAVTWVVDLAQACEKVQLKVVCAWMMHFGFPQRILRMLCGYFEHHRRVLVEECVAIQN